jgi:hypothetical protein
MDILYIYTLYIYICICKGLAAAIRLKSRRQSLEGVALGHLEPLESFTVLREQFRDTFRARSCMKVTQIDARNLHNITEMSFGTQPCFVGVFVDIRGITVLLGPGITVSREPTETK